jgi:hypothetical protein
VLAPRAVTEWRPPGATPFVGGARAGQNEQPKAVSDAFVASMMFGPESDLTSMVRPFEQWAGVEVRSRPEV